jgi:DNA repair protein RecO (recombination protein O)
MTLYRDRGVVLRTYKLGEADRIVHLVTEGHGKVRAVAKGVRKTKSRFGARLEPCSHVALLLYEGRELDVVTQAEGIDHFRAIRDDLDRLAKATTLLEAVDHVTQEGERNPVLYRMLVGALRALDHANSPALVGAFLWKLLSAEGVHPVLEMCVRCGASGPLVAFDLVEGGALCRSCRSGTPISSDALVLLRRTLGGELGAVLTEPASRATTDVESLATTALERHVERRLRSVTALQRH